MPKNWDHAAGLVWPVLTDAAKRRRLLTYSDVAPVIPTNPLSVGRALGPIQSHCLDRDLPPLTAIVINKNKRVPGRGFIATEALLSDAHEMVFAHDWSKDPNPYRDFAPDQSEESLAKIIISNPETAAEICALVKVRGVRQRIFRRVLLKAQGAECVMCGCSFEEVLQAAHIMPWTICSKAEQLSPTNGLLLCANHHRLFDEHLITVDQTYKITYVDPECEGDHSDMDKAISVSLHGKLLKVPKDPKYRPSPELLRKRQATFGLGSQNENTHW